MGCEKIQRWPSRAVSQYVECHWAIYQGSLPQKSPGARGNSFVQIYPISDFLWGKLAVEKAASLMLSGCVTQAFRGSSGMPDSMPCSVTFLSSPEVADETSHPVHVPGLVLSVRPSDFLARSGGIKSRKLASWGNPRLQIRFAFATWVDKEVRSKLQMWGGKRQEGMNIHSWIGWWM